MPSASATTSDGDSKAAWRRARVTSGDCRTVRAAGPRGAAGSRVAANAGVTPADDEAQGRALDAPAKRPRSSAQGAGMIAVNCPVRTQP